MDVRINQGYIITDSCHVGDSEFVLGVHSTAPQQFVTWKCSNQTDYYWGHYFSDLFAAQKDLVARAQEELQYLEEKRQNPVRQKAPGYSPWGEVQTCETLCPGAYSVSTAGHGGVMVHRDLADKVFRKEAKECGFAEGVYLCFEEDCDGPVALRELMDKKLYQAPVNQYFRPGEYEAVINRSLQTYHPEYWQAREKDLKEKGQPSIQRKKKERER
ncbi:MAG TPA: hypothetical protein IAC31_03970 [Candidatus Faecousia intestinigallinarum]|nr:hypothetical protein [Candidatus Faecousia intestinigallinarum]